jgi:hypothetical protein
MKARRGEGHLAPGQGDWSEAGRAHTLLQSDMCMECGKRADGRTDAKTSNYYCEACWAEWGEGGSDSSDDEPGGTNPTSSAAATKGARAANTAPSPLGLLAGYGSD